jgi:hypothetical protein
VTIEEQVTPLYYQVTQTYSVFDVRRNDTSIFKILALIWVDKVKKSMMLYSQQPTLERS